MASSSKRHRVRSCKLSPIKPKRFSVRQNVKKKNPKKLLGSGPMKSSLLHFGYRGGCRFAEGSESDARELVHSALKKFDELRRQYSTTGSKPAEILKMMKTNYPRFIVNRHLKGDARVGSIPGIEVGDFFSFRAELCVVGLHKPTQAGIDWIETSAKDGFHRTTMAVSIVVSGAYEDDQDLGETLVYTGEGGNDLQRSRKQFENQKLQKGTEALHNSKTLKNPVRVIRARKDPRSPSGRFHSYDGLYLVVASKKEKGKSGFDVYKFTLVREPEQKLLIWPPPPFGNHSNSQTFLADLCEEHERAQSTECRGLKAFLGPGERQKSVVLGGGKGDEKGGIQSSIGGEEKSVNNGGTGKATGVSRDLERRFEDVSGVAAKPVYSLGDGKAHVNGAPKEATGSFGDGKDLVLGMKRRKEDGDEGDEYKPLVFKRVKPLKDYTRGEALLAKSESQVDNLKKAQSNVPNKYITTRKFWNAKSFRNAFRDKARTNNKDGVQKKDNEKCSGAGQEEQHNIRDGNNVSDGSESDDDVWTSNSSESENSMLENDMSGRDGSMTDSDVIGSEDIEYEVECILQMRVPHGSRVEEYLVLWKDYPRDEATWESRENLVNCDEALEEYEWRSSIKGRP